MTASRWYFAVLPWAAVAGLSGQDRIERTDALFPGAVERPGEEWLLARVVDDLTGQPLAGADVFLVEESETPLAGAFWFTRKVQTDADGWLRAPVGDIRGKWHIQVLRHPACGVATRSGFGDAIWRVGRPFDVPVLVRDWQCRPVPGAKVGFCGGCGHTPDVVVAVAGADGVAVLRGIDPQNDIRDVYVQHAGLALGYRSLRWHPGDPPWAIDCAWAPAKSGRVVDHLGAPVAGAFVGALDVHRGPWAKTAADGTFTVLGAPVDTGTSRVRLADGRDCYFQSPASYPATLRLPAPEAADPHEGTVECAPAHAPSPATRNVRVRVVDAPSPRVDVVAVFPGKAGDGAAEPGTVAVPVAGPCLLIASDASVPFVSEREFAFADSGAFGDEVVLRWQPDVQVVGRALDAQGQPLAVGVRWRSSWSGGDEHDEPDLVPCPDGRFALPCAASGLALLEVAPLAAGVGARFVWVTVPRREQQPLLELGDVVLGGPPQLRVLDADGRPPPDATVGFARAGLQEPGELRTWPLAADGAWRGPDLRTGDAVVVQLDDEALPFRTVLSGDGPWTIAVPRGELVLQVVDAVGELLPATVVIGDLEIDADFARPLRGLPHGPLRCHVAAPGRRCAIVTTTIGRERQTVRVELLPR